VGGEGGDCGAARLIPVLNHSSAIQSDVFDLRLKAGFKIRSHGFVSGGDALQFNELCNSMGSARTVLSGFVRKQRMCV